MRNILKSDHGNIALMAALMLPLVLGFAGAGLDYVRYHKAVGDLQEIADAAALTGAKEYFAVAPEIPTTVAENIAEKSLATTTSGDGAVATVSGVQNDYTVTVTISRDYEPTLFVSFYKNPLPLTVTSTAQAVGGTNICVIALDEDKPAAIVLDDNAQLTGNDCAVYSNSTHTAGLQSTSSANLDTAFTCTSGGYDGNGSNFNPLPLTDCPPRSDPLASRPPPTVGACSNFPDNIVDETTTLSPGVYCGGLKIDGASIITLDPGIYVIKDGDLKINGTAVVQGDGVGFYFVGASSRLEVSVDTTLSLTAPETGQMAGLLMFQDRNANEDLIYQISSNNADKLVGTIYTPNARFFVDASAPVAASSAYTAVIASKIQLTSSVNLVLNTNYAATNVPVPDGIANADGDIRLRQ